MKNRLNKILVALGILFVLNAIFGRYLVLPGNLEGLDQGTSTLDGAVQTVSVWKAVRYMIWAYSVKLGIYFTFLGALLRTSLSTVNLWLVAIGGFVYIAFAYIPLPEPTLIVLGLAGGAMTLIILYVIWLWPRERDKLAFPHRRSSDLRMV